MDKGAFTKLKFYDYVEGKADMKKDVLKVLDKCRERNLLHEKRCKREDDGMDWLLNRARRDEDEDIKKRVEALK